MIYETNKVKLDGLVRSKEIANDRFIVKIVTGKHFREIIPCYVREGLYNKMEISRLYSVDGYLIPRDEHNNDLALEVTKINEATEFNSKQYVDVMFTIEDKGFPRSDVSNTTKQVRDLTVKFLNDNISNLDVEVSLWSKLATFDDIEDGREAYASCYITTNNRTKKLKLIPHYFKILEGN